MVLTTSPICLWAGRVLFPSSSDSFLLSFSIVRGILTIKFSPIPASDRGRNIISLVGARKVGISQLIASPLLFLRALGSLWLTLKLFPCVPFPSGHRNPRADGLGRSWHFVNVSQVILGGGRERLSFVETVFVAVCSCSKEDSNTLEGNVACVLLGTFKGHQF